jgi:hypothetical protein
MTDNESLVVALETVAKPGMKPPTLGIHSTALEQPVTVLPSLLNAAATAIRTLPTDYAAGIEAAAKRCDEDVAALQRDADAIQNDPDPELLPDNRAAMVRLQLARASAVRRASHLIRSLLHRTEKEG